MKIAVKTIKFLCAAAIAFAPSVSVAFASNSSSKIKVHALTMAEMQSEYGAGGGGGGTGSGGSGSGCSVDLDSDGHCDYQGSYAVGITNEGSGAAYRNLFTKDLPCNPTTAGMTSSGEMGCTYEMSIQFGVSVSIPGITVEAPWGDFGLSEISANISLGLTGVNYIVKSSYIDTYTVQATGTRYYGSYVFEWKDNYDSFGMSSSFGYVTGTKSDTNKKWSKNVWRQIYLAKTNSRKWW